MADTTDWTLEGATAQIELLQESVQDMQALLAEDRGWSSLDGTHGTRFTREDLNKAAMRCRIMAALNPLIKRGLTIRAGYVWGQGIGITAKDDTLNDIVQEWIDDDENRSILTGHQAHLDLESRIGTDGNVFISLWTEPLAGKVVPRLLEFTEIQDKITDPDDAAKARLYKRVHTANGRSVTTYYPDLRYRPRLRAKVYGEGQDRGEIRWDAPVLHVHDNALTNTQWGLGDAYAAVDWAKGYSRFLNNWGRLTEALSKIAWTLSSESKSKAQTARAGLNAAADGTAGGTINMGPGQKLEAVPKSGATIDSESGRPIAAMTAAALGVPVTMLLADPGATGARAVAETLDTPTENEMMGRRELWTEAFRAILNHVIDQAAYAPRNDSGLRGRLIQDRDRQRIELVGDIDRTLVFDWPDLSGDDPATVIEAALKALDTGKFQGAAEVKLIEIVLRALRVRDVDELLDEITDEDGNLLDNTVNAGQAAVDAFNRGEDPAAALR